MPSATDAAFEAFSRRRDEASFRAMYRHHTPTLFALAVRLCRSRHQAEEVIQEAWVRAIARLDEFRGRSRYSTWLAGIVVNCAREQVRRQQRLRPLDQDGTAALAAVPDPGSALDLESALRALPAGYREVVVLHDLHGYTHREIAGLLEIEEGTSKSQLNRGRARLRELLTPPHQENRGLS